MRKRNICKRVEIRWASDRGRTNELILMHKCNGKKMREKRSLSQGNDESIHVSKHFSSWGGGELAVVTWKPMVHVHIANSEVGPSAVLSRCKLLSWSPDSFLHCTIIFPGQFIGHLLVSTPQLFHHALFSCRSSVNSCCFMILFREKPEYEQNFFLAPAEEFMS